MTGSGVEIEGAAELGRKLTGTLDETTERAMAGLLAGGLVIQGESQRRVPVEYGNLRGSAYTRRAMDDPRAVEVGYTAAYAIFVHENMEQKLKGEPRPSGLGEYWGPSGEPKYLENSAREKADDVVKIVTAYAREGLKT